MKTKKAPQGKNEEIEDWLMKSKQEEFRIANVVVELNHFSSWGSPLKLIKVIEVIGTTTYSDVLEIKRDGIYVARVSEGCFESENLGGYELSYQKIKKLIRDQKGTYRDAGLAISKKDLYRMLKFEKTFEEFQEKESEKIAQALTQNQ